MVWEGDDIIETSKRLIGDEDPQDAALGTIRGDYGLCEGRNSVHGSDSVESAEREIKLWFTEDEICTFKNSAEDWIYEKALETEEIKENFGFIHIGRLSTLESKVSQVKNVVIKTLELMKTRA